MQIIHRLTNNFSVKKYVSIALLGAVLGTLVCFFLLYSEQQEGAVYDIKDGVLAALCGVLIALVIYKSTQFLNKIISWQTQTGNRLFVGLLVHFIIAFSLSVGLFYLYDKLLIQTPAFGKVYESVLLKLQLFYVLLC